jgi:hypothetical protein
LNTGLKHAVAIRATTMTERMTHSLGDLDLRLTASTVTGLAPEPPPPEVRGWLRRENSASRRSPDMRRRMAMATNVTLTAPNTTVAYPPKYSGIRP